MNKIGRWLACAAMVLSSALAGAASTFDAELLEIQQAWAVANYETPPDAREAAFAQLQMRAEKLAADYPERAEALVWQGIVQSSHAGAKGGLGALGLAKKARSSLESAIRLDPAALQGSAYTSLGTLYYKVPGFPLGFGDHDKAQELLRKALALNPDGIDPNYLYGEFLYEEGRYPESLQYLDRAAHAPARPGRELADQGRRAEIAALAVKVRARVG